MLVCEGLCVRPLQAQEEVCQLQAGGNSRSSSCLPAPPPSFPRLISKVQIQEDLLLCRAQILIVLEPCPSSGLSLLVTDQ